MKTYERKRILEQFLTKSNRGGKGLSVGFCLNTINKHLKDKNHCNVYTNPQILMKKLEKSIKLRIVNTFKCNSLWACPYCTEVKQHKVRTRLSDVIIGLGDKLGKVTLRIYFSTLTLSHKYADKLTDSMDILTGAWRATTAHKRVKEERKGSDYLGAQRWTEITFGQHGFHPHIHLIEFALNDYDFGVARDQFIEEVKKRGRRSMLRAQDSQEISRARALELCGYAWTKKVKKINKLNETLSVRKRHFFLNDRIDRLEKNRYKDEKLMEYLVATYGRHAYHISPKLLALSGVNDDDGDESTGKDPDEEVLFTVPGTLWERAAKQWAHGLYVERLMKTAYTLDKTNIYNFLMPFADEYEKPFLYNQLSMVN